MLIQPFTPPYSTILFSTICRAFVIDWRTFYIDCLECQICDFYIKTSFLWYFHPYSIISEKKKKGWHGCRFHFRLQNLRCHGFEQPPRLRLIVSAHNCHWSLHSLTQRFHNSTSFHRLQSPRIFGYIYWTIKCNHARKKTIVRQHEDSSWKLQHTFRPLHIVSPVRPNNVWQYRWFYRFIFWSSP